MKVITPDLSPESQTIAWVSGGAASAVACYLFYLEALKQSPTILPLFVRIDPLSEHPDTQRFVDECSLKLFDGIPIHVISVHTHGSPIYKDCHSHYDILRKVRGIRFVSGAPCTRILKREVRDNFQTANHLNSHIWGFCKGEEKRMHQMMAQPGYHHFPLIEQGLTKQDCFSLLESKGILLPEMYRLGFNNNNCFVGKQRFLTTDGPKAFEDCVGTEQKVLTRAGWKKSDVLSFGEQPIVKLTLQDPMTKEITEILTTANHRWLVPRYKSITQGEVETETMNLKPGKMIPRWFAHGSWMTDVSGSQQFMIGAANGIVFGDGSKYTCSSGFLSKAYIDESKKELNVFFENVPRCCSSRPRAEGGAKSRRGSIHHGLPGNLKDFPDLSTMSDEYALGFLAGLIATDGNVSGGGVSP